MSDSNKPPMNKNVIYVFICISLLFMLLFKESFFDNAINLTILFISTVLTFGFGTINLSIKWHTFMFPFYILLFILWFNKYASSKIKALFGFQLQGGNLSVTRTIPEPGVYNVFSDMITGIGNGFIYIVTLQFLYPTYDN
jgi:hypothetical protein